MNWIFSLVMSLKKHVKPVLKRIIAGQGTLIQPMTI